MEKFGVVDLCILDIERLSQHHACRIRWVDEVRDYASSQRGRRGSNTRSHLVNPTEDFYL